MEKIRRHDHYDKNGKKLELYYDEGKLVNAHGEPVEVYYDDEGRFKLPFLEQHWRVWLFVVIVAFVICVLAAIGFWYLMRFLFH